MDQRVLTKVERPDASPVSITAVIVSRNRPDELRKTVDVVRRQATGANLSILIIDSSSSFSPISIFAACRDVSVIRSTINIGGAGGFALGMLTAIAGGAAWLWLMDDDGRPLHDFALQDLLDQAEANGLDAVAPVVLDSADHTRFAFPYPIGGRYIFRREQLAAGTFIPSMAHLFNGLLIRRSAVFKVGLPDIRLFIRGDEIDFLYRMRRAGLRFGTTTSVPFAHPSSDHELFPIWGGRLHVVYPAAAWKRRRQYRNRGYNFFRNREFLIIAVDFIRYPYFFLFLRRFDLAGLTEWGGCMWRGMRGQVYVEPLADPAPLIPARISP